MGQNPEQQKAVFVEARESGWQSQAVSTIAYGKHGI